MDSTRRQVLVFGALAAASATVPLNAIAGITAADSKAAPSGPAKTDYDNLSRLTVEDFKPWVGSVFDMFVDSSRTILVILSEVQDPPVLPKSTKTVRGTASSPEQNSATQRTAAFALRFKSLSGEALEQGTYVFENGALGRFALFVVPSGTDQETIYYTAQVNRLLQ
jgi:hypothetical protein